MKFVVISYHQVLRDYHWMFLTAVWTLHEWNPRYALKSCKLLGLLEIVDYSISILCRKVTCWTWILHICSKHAVSILYQLQPNPRVIVSNLRQCKIYYCVLPSQHQRVTCRNHSMLFACVLGCILSSFHQLQGHPSIHCHDSLLILCLKWLPRKQISIDNTCRWKGYLLLVQ